MFSTRPPRGRPPPCASIWDNFVHRDADDASGAESQLYLGARALDTRERYTSEKLATRGRGGVFSMPTKKVVIPRAALRNHDSRAGANTRVDDNSSVGVEGPSRVVAYTTDVVHQREGFVQLR